MGATAENVGCACGWPLDPCNPAFAHGQPCDYEQHHGWPYVWFWRVKHGDRKGQRCRVWARGTMNSIGVVFPDGFRTVTSRHAIRRGT